MPHPRRLANYTPLNIRLTASSLQYLASLRQPGESNSALLNRLIAEHREMRILERWNKKLAGGK